MEINLCHCRLSHIIFFSPTTSLSPCGMRSGELRALKWEHIDKKKGFIRLPAELTKESKAKVIPINHHVEAVFDSLPQHLLHNFVFTYKGKPLDTRYGMKKSFATACSEAGIPYGRKEQNGVTLHDIRRTVKTNMADSGMGKSHRDAILGHSSNDMDAHYIHLSEKSLKAAMNKFTVWLDERLKETSRKSENVDQNVDQKQKSGKAVSVSP